MFEPFKINSRARAHDGLIPSKQHNHGLAALSLVVGDMADLPEVRTVVLIR
jgi:hypothetical protein